MPRNAPLRIANTLLLVTFVLSKSTGPIFFIIIINVIFNISTNITRKTFYFLCLWWNWLTHLYFFLTHRFILFFSEHCQFNSSAFFHAFFLFFVSLLQTYFFCIGFHIFFIFCLSSADILWYWFLEYPLFYIILL